MRRYLPVWPCCWPGPGPSTAHGLLIPEDKTLPPLAMLNHKVTIAIEDQVAVTRVEQTFRNHTDRHARSDLRLPRAQGRQRQQVHHVGRRQGSQGRDWSRPTRPARSTPTSSAAPRTPACSSTWATTCCSCKVFPIPAHGDQKVDAELHQPSPPTRTALVEYIYPLKTDGKATSHAGRVLHHRRRSSRSTASANVYSPTHAITLKRANDKEVTVNFDKDQGLLDKDFQLFYSTGDKDVGLTALTHRPIATRGRLLHAAASRRKVEMPKEYQVPRDMVLVLDTSGSMRGVKMEQARKALKYCLDNLGPKDRFALHQLRHHGQPATATSCSTPRRSRSTQAKKWVREAGGDRRHGHRRRPGAGPGATAASDEGRSFTIVFFTDGQPTIGETNTRQDPQEHRGQEHGQHAHLHLRRRRRRQRHLPRQSGRADARPDHLRAAGRGHRGQGERPVQPRSAIRC